jgi:DNA-binding SARP family transcriptional activator
MQNLVADVTQARAVADEVRAPPIGRWQASGLRLELLNRFELTHRGEPIRLPIPVQRLVAFLAIEDRVVRRNYVASMLWVDSTEERAFGSLRSALWRLRQVEYRLVEATSCDLCLAAGLHVDLREATAWTRRICSDGWSLDDLDVDAAAFTSDLLPDWYDDWIVPEREHFRELRVRALERLCERHTAAGRFGPAIDAAYAAVRNAPMRESAHRALIGVHLAEGNHAEALRRYESYRDLLVRQLGVEPSSRIRELVAGLTG